MALSLPLPNELSEELRAIAESEGLTVQQVAVTVISEYVQRHEISHARRLAEQFADRNRSLLDRLGNA
jgi:hypothetical protein